MTELSLVNVLSIKIQAKRSYVYLPLLHTVQEFF